MTESLLTKAQKEAAKELMRKLELTAVDCNKIYTEVQGLLGKNVKGIPNLTVELAINILLHRPNTFKDSMDGWDKLWDGKCWDAIKFILIPSERFNIYDRAYKRLRDRIFNNNGTNLLIRLIDFETGKYVKNTKKWEGASLQWTQPLQIIYTNLNELDIQNTVVPIIAAYIKNSWELDVYTMLGINPVKGLEVLKELYKKELVPDEKLEDIIIIEDINYIDIKRYHILKELIKYDKKEGANVILLQEYA